MSLLLADDLSGALEAGAAFQRCGWKAGLYLSGSTPPPIGPDDLLVLSTETRGADPEEARRRVTEAVAGARSAGRRMIFKKIDSTLRGPVGAELQALLAADPDATLFFSPANPAAGRTVRDGLLRVRGVPLAESEFRNDPTAPARESVVARVLAQAGPLPSAELPLEFLRQPKSDWLARLAEMAKAGRRLFLCDAESDEDLRRLVETAHASVPAPSFVGSGALAGAVAGFRPPRNGAAPPAPPPLRAPALFVCGSRHPVSRAQMAALGVALVSWTPGTTEEEAARALEGALKADGVAALAAGPEASNPGEISLSLGRITAQLAGRVSLGSLTVTGGETARAVSQALGGDRLEILGEYEPGVAASEMPLGRVRILLVTKPGGFGDEKTFRRLRDRLRSAAT